MDTSLNLILFCHARSGSSSLYKILQSHPHLNILEEPFNENFTRWYPEQKNYLALIKDQDSLDQQLAEIFSQYKGLKVLQYQLSRELYSHMLGQPGYRIIFLRRRNLLQTVVSGLIAEQTGLWKRWEQARPLAEIYANLAPLDLADIRNRVTYLNENLAFFDEVISARPAGTYFKVVYEDFYFSSPAHREATLGQIFAFLGLEPLAPETVQAYLDPAQAKLNSAQSYRYLPNAVAINETLGSDETGWLF